MRTLKEAIEETYRIERRREIVAIGFMVFGTLALAAVSAMILLIVIAVPFATPEGAVRPWHLKALLAVSSAAGLARSFLFANEIRGRLGILRETREQYKKDLEGCGRLFGGIDPGADGGSEMIMSVARKTDCSGVEFISTADFMAGRYARDMKGYEWHNLPWGETRMKEEETK